MFNLSSPQDQVSNFIVNNAYSGQTKVKKNDHSKAGNILAVITLIIIQEGQL